MNFQNPKTRYTVAFVVGLVVGAFLAAYPLILNAAHSAGIYMHQNHPAPESYEYLEEWKAQS